jgi:hypothetical protein
MQLLVRNAHERVSCPLFFLLSTEFDFATNTMEWFIARTVRVYEQEHGELCRSPLFGL